MPSINRKAITGMYTASQAAKKGLFSSKLQEKHTSEAKAQQELIRK
jgi:hypothetical protein